MADKRKVLSMITEETDRLLAARLLDRQAHALDTGRVQVTDFLDPREQNLAALLMQQEPSLRYELEGGYPQAERRRLVMMPQGTTKDETEAGIALLQVKGDFRFEAPAHRDVLGAVMGLGIKREKVGDILIQPDGAQVFVTEELVSLLEMRLTGIGAVSVSTAEIPVEAVATPEERVKELRATVASLRLDSIAAHGFSTSRSQMAREIKSMKVRLNWRPADDPSLEVKAGDVISIRGRGRVVVEAVTGETKKGRIGLLLKRFL